LYEKAIAGNVRSGLDAEALRLARHWRGVLPHLPKPDEAALQTRNACLLLLMSAAVHRGLWGKLAEFIDEFSVSHHALPNAEQTVLLTYYRALSASVRGRSSEARHLFETLQIGKLGRSLRVQVLEFQARMEFLAGRTPVAQNYLKQIGEIEDISWGFKTRLDLLHTQLLAAERLVQQMDSQEVPDSLKSIADKTRTRSMFELSGQAELSLGLWILYHNQLGQAEVALHQALRLLRMGDYAPVEARSLMALGLLKLWQGDREQAQQYLLQAQDLAVYCGDLRVATEAELHAKAGLLTGVAEAQQIIKSLEPLVLRCRKAEWDDLLWLLSLYRQRAGLPCQEPPCEHLADINLYPWARYPLYRAVVNEKDRL